MNKPVEQALTSLVPSLSGPIPAELANLAISLLAQSRSKAGSLKPEEEIARIYACAHLACERLKQQLNLPQIEPRPPAPPRTYKKVFAYFSTALAPRPTRTSSKQSAINDKRATPVSTPVKSRTPAKGTPSKTTPWKGKILDRAHRTTEETPEWVMPAIRQLCKAFDAPAAVPHVFVGLSSVLQFQRTHHSQTQNATATPWKSASRSRLPQSATASDFGLQNPVIDESRIPALAAVILFYTLSRLSGKDTNHEQYIQQRELALSTLRGLSADVRQSQEGLAMDIEVFMREAQKGWLQLDWYQNIVEGAGLKGKEADKGDTTDQRSEHEDIEDDEIGNTPASHRTKRARLKNELGVPRSGLGTMMHDSIDWLSEERRLDYIKWKAGIMARIEHMGREQGIAVDSTAR